MVVARRIVAVLASFGTHTHFAAHLVAGWLAYFVRAVLSVFLLDRFRAAPLVSPAAHTVFLVAPLSAA